MLYVASLMSCMTVVVIGILVWNSRSDPPSNSDGVIMGRPQGSQDDTTPDLGGGPPGPSIRNLPQVPGTANPPAGSIVGKDLKQFAWIDSLVVPRGAAPEVQNITQVGPGVFRHVLRMGNGWHDGDRHLTHGAYAKKGRAELTSLGGGTPMGLGETWLIGSTVLFDKDFQPSQGYCQIAQPVLHQSYFNFDLQGDTMVGRLMVFERGLGSPSRLVREVSVKRGQWLTWTLKVKFGADGSYALSVNGDDFRGININTEIGHVKGATVGKVSQFGGTWGLYCPMNGPARELVVYHANPFLKKVG